MVQRRSTNLFFPRCSITLQLASGVGYRDQRLTIGIGRRRNLPKAVIEAIRLHANELYCVVPLFVEI
jgi:hypothetical protein